MKSQWTKNDAPKEDQPHFKAVAYYRTAAEIREHNSVEIQQDRVRAFAAQHHIEIIHEFADRGKSGLTATGRPAFMEMMDWVRQRHDFALILVQDVSRWGRFQDINLAAHYESLCPQYGKKLVYTNFTGDEDPLIDKLRHRKLQFESRVCDASVVSGGFDM